MSRTCRDRGGSRPLRAGWALMVLCGLLVLGALPAAADGPPPYTGLRLERALRSLQAQGLRLVYTSRLVRPKMRVTEEPTATEPRAVLDQLLAPHGLAARDTEGGHVLVVPAPPSTVAEEPAGLAVAEEEIEVLSTWPWIAGEELSVLTLDRQDLQFLPHLGTDFVRSMTLLPGTSGNDVSAGFSVRGGRQDEVMVRLDGLEILEPFHLPDFNDALSILAPETIGQVRLMTGGFSAEYGDRMSGVLDLTTVDPSWDRRAEIGLSVVDLKGSSSGTWKNGQRQWLASLRAGSLELPFRIADEEENPTFGDLFTKLEFELRPGGHLRANFLYSEDRLDFTEVEEVDDEEVREGFQNKYDNNYSWVRHQAILSPRLYFESQVSLSRVERDRNGSEIRSDLPEEPGEEDEEPDEGDDPSEDGFTLVDRRDLRAVGLGQDWNLRLGQRQTWKWGFDLRFLKAGYNYLNLRTLDDPLAAIRDVPRVGTTRFDQRFRGEQLGLYASDRLTLGDRLTLELGLRFDHNSILDDEDLSPRLSLAWATGVNSRLRASWGRYRQSQRLYELQVEDGETQFSESELAEHWSLGFEHSFNVAESSRRPLTLRAEFYRREIDDPRARWENLFEPLSIVPELEADRVRVAPESSLAEGFEIFLEGASGRRLHWFLSYTWATTEDRIAGRDVPRSIDQPQTLKLDVGYRSPWRWHFNLAFQVYSGRPTTALDAVLVDDGEGDTEVVPVLGPLYGERLPAYQRVDFRASRDWTLRRGQLRFFLDVQNLANHLNVRGFDFVFDDTDDGVVVILDENSWGGIRPSLGIRWSF